MDKTLVVYFTGTGSSKLVADAVEHSMMHKGVQVESHRLTEKTKTMLVDKAEHFDALILIYAVHAFNAPDMVYQWLDSLKPSTHKKAMVISVSGGGDMISNTACRLSAKKRLKAKGFDIITEGMVTMPNNWMSATPMEISKTLVNVMPKKVERWVEAFLANQSVPYLSTKVIDRLITRLGRFEVKGARVFGQNIKSNDSCNGCGWCEKNCPASNIVMILESAEKHPIPQFSSVCEFCLGCIYGCPQKALVPTKMSFAVIKSGYPLKEYVKPMDSALTEEELKTKLKGFSWKGVRTYLELK